jgi:hypothetical protein
MRDDERDWWQVVAIAVLAAIVLADVVVPAMTLLPVARAAERMADADPRPEELISALPSVAWPVLAIVLGLGVVGLGVWRMYAEGAAESRWLWIVVMAGVTVLWSLGDIAVLSRAAKSIAGIAAGMR